MPALYFALFAATGIFLPYLPPYYRTLGFDGTAIALVTSIPAVLMVLVPPVWGFVADRTRRPALLLRVAACGATLGFAPLLGVRTFAGVAATLALGGIFSTALASLADAATVGRLRRTGGSYARIRLWGSLGFVASSYLFGLHLDRGGAASDAVAVGLCLYALTFAATLRVPEGGDGHLQAPSLAEARRLAASPAFLAFLGASALHWAALSPFHLFFAVHLGELGESPAWIGAGLAGAVVAEVAVLWSWPRLAARFPLYGLLAVAYLAGTVRWTLTALLGAGAPLAAVQLLHGLVFGAFWAGSIAHLERTVPKELLATGRALFGAAAFGIGGVGGNLLAGALFDAGGGRLAFGAAAGLDLLAPLLLVVAARLAAPTARSAAEPGG